MIYTKPRNELSWNDVEEFCQQGIPEGAHLDYKQDFPRHLGRTISAMANTFGGIILIGVEADDENKPVVPIAGIPFQRGLEERVTNIILANITPPVFPEIIPLADASGQRAVAAIRVHQSDQTPHAISDNTQVYLRTGNRNTPEALATIKEIEWLQSRRQQSRELGNRLYGQANERFDTVHTWQIKALGIPPNPYGWLTLSFCPLYPKELLKTPSEMSGVYDTIRIRDYFETFPHFPPPGLSQWNGRTVQDGILLNNRWETSERFFHTELNCFGLFFYRQSLERIPEHPRGANSFRATEIPVRLDQFLDTAIRYYETLGYWGLLQFRAKLGRVDGCGIFLEGLHNKRLFSPELCPDPEIFTTRTVLTSALEAEKKQLILESFRQMTWAFGWKDMAQRHINEYYDG